MARDEGGTGVRDLVLVGHGMVGQRFLEEWVGLPGVREGWRVTVVAEEARPAYDRVRLTSWFSGTSAEELALCAPEFLAAHGIERVSGDPAVAVDRAARTVTTASGRVLGYDALVLATGSFPFVPPVPGRGAPGCHVYRTLEDVAGIRADAVATAEALAGARPAVGVVVGGGLLGLEAAGALRELGLETHVVEFAPRLMAIQVDEGGGATLRRAVEGLGVRVRTGAGTERIVTGPDGRVRAMGLSDGTELPADLVVFSAGVRPRDALARECGLTVGERGGIVVDEGCRTSDPAVWAVGECALTVDGRVYGLVAPGYAMAGTAAARIAGKAGAGFTGADTSTKLKLLGVDVASFGDAHGVTAGALDVVYADSRAGVYKKLVIGADGALLGGVLVGDTEDFGSLRPLALAGEPLTVPPERLVLPAGPGGGARAELPESAVVCSCNNVTKGEIRAAVHGAGCGSTAEVKGCTRAGASCGSCLKLVGRIVDGALAERGVTAARGICEHFAHTRSELYEIVRVRGVDSFSRLIDEHGSGEGCEVCKPVVASILAGPGGGHVLDGERAGLQDTNDHFLANLQRGGSYSVVPRVPGGEITPEGLIVIGEIARDFGLYTKITGGQRIDLLGARVDQLPPIWARLVVAGFESGHAYGKALRTVKSCVGESWCRYGVGDAVGLAIELELRYRGLRAPHKLKSAVSGCARECAEARSKDFGVIASSTGWNLWVGGNGGMTPRHADLLAADLDRETLLRTVDRFLMFYVRTAEPLERTAPWLERLDGGLEHLRAVVMQDSLGICADLDELMARHVSTYEDEWAATLADPDRLRRFVSFANAPGVPDPTVRFAPEREQIRPARAGDLVAGAALEVRTR
ncbi:nitrite reductase large subunit NirB [Streptomyces sp. BI20]|uniref:nitrite reductase large subunit NirB n=1 Tax=Streptomyces sp. BI20 TaxID=3403460 RepID=UPI003C76C0F3